MSQQQQQVLMPSATTNSVLSPTAGATATPTSGSTPNIAAAPFVPSKALMEATAAALSNSSSQHASPRAQLGTATAFSNNQALQGLGGSVDSGLVSPANVLSPTAAPSGSTTPSTALLQQQQMPMSMIVVDPKSRKLDIPLDAIHETRALQRSGIPSLCMLFLQGRCRQGKNCHQCHADPTVVAQLREAAKNMPSCCRAHGDYNSCYALPEWRMRSFQINDVSIPADRVAFTVGLRRYMEEAASTPVTAPIVVGPSSVCRLHAADRCRYSEDCKFLHVCREIINDKLSNWVIPLNPEEEHQKKRAAQQQAQQQVQQQQQQAQQGGRLLHGHVAVHTGFDEASIQQWLAQPAPDGGVILYAPIAPTSPITDGGDVASPLPALSDTGAFSPSFIVSPGSMSVSAARSPTTLSPPPQGAAIGPPAPTVASSGPTSPAAVATNMTTTYVPPNMITASNALDTKQVSMRSDTTAATSDVQTPGPSNNKSVHSRSNSGQSTGGGAAAGFCGSAALANDSVDGADRSFTDALEKMGAPVVRSTSVSTAASHQSQQGAPFGGFGSSQLAPGPPAQQLQQEPEGADLLPREFLADLLKQAETDDPAPSNSATIW